MTNDILSLRTHLMNWLFTPLFVLWVFSTATGYVATLKYANRPYDQALLERAQTLAVQLMPAGGEGKPPPKEEEFYSVYDSADRFLAGSVALPRPPDFQLRKTVPVFTDAEFRGIKIRMVILRFPAEDGRALRLQLGERVDKRQALIRGILANIVIPQLLLILMAGAAVWYALKRGLAPLEHLRQEVAERSRTDLRLLNESRPRTRYAP
jgi:Two-component sensor kinase N-terminal.